MKENIEEDIEILEELKETYRFLISIRTEEIPADKKLMKRIQAIDHILSDYKRVLKENEQKNKMIDLMAEDIYDSQIECNRYFRDKEKVKKK